MTINENAAYLKGLFEGYELDKSSKEVKIISEMLDLITKMSEQITVLTEENAELRDYIEEIDEDLGAVEEDLYFTDGDEEDYDDLNDGEFDGEDSEYYELECPNCGETVCFDDSLDPDSLICPACGEPVGEVEFCDGECESCDDKICESEE